MFEFQFNMTNDELLYITHDTNVIDIKLINFLNQIDFDWTELISFTVTDL